MGQIKIYWHGARCPHMLGPQGQESGARCPFAEMAITAVKWS